nr:MAG TPA: Integrase [Caudoviricetes sp.]
MLLEEGAPIKFVQQRLGHKDIETTLNIYAHLTDKMEEQGVEILNRL